MCAPEKQLKLKLVTARLRTLNFLIGGLTALNLTVCAVVWLAPMPAFVVLAGAGFCLAYFTLWRWARWRRAGDDLFDEISDELAWDMKGRPGKVADERPTLDTRIILRSFIQEEVLLFAPPKFDLLLYALLNLAAFVLAIGFKSILLKLAGS